MLIPLIIHSPTVIHIGNSQLHSIGLWTQSKKNLNGSVTQTPPMLLLSSIAFSKSVQENKIFLSNLSIHSTKYVNTVLISPSKNHLFSL